MEREVVGFENEYNMGTHAKKEGLLILYLLVLYRIGDSPTHPKVKPIFRNE